MDAVGLIVGRQRWATWGERNAVQTSTRECPQRIGCRSRGPAFRKRFPSVVGCRLLGHDGRFRRVLLLRVRGWANAPLLIGLQRVCDHCC